MSDNLPKPTIASPAGDHKPVIAGGDEKKKATDAGIAASILISNKLTKVWVTLIIGIIGFIGGIGSWALSDFDKSVWQRLVVGPIASIIAYGLSAALHGETDDERSLNKLISFQGIAMALIFGIGGV